MRFYQQQHQFYCGIDLHAQKMYICMIDQKGKTRLHKNSRTEAEMFCELISPFLTDIVSFLVSLIARLGSICFAECTLQE